MNPVLFDFPEEIETPRLLLRPPRKGDGAELNVAVRESIAGLRPWLAWAREVPSPEESETRVREAMANFILRRHEMWFLAFLRDGGPLIGCCGLHHLDWQVPRFEIGYWVRTGYGGHGYVSEAVGAITAFS